MSARPRQWCAPRPPTTISAMMRHHATRCRNTFRVAAGPRSSAGQSAGLLIRWSQVRVLPGASQRPLHRAAPYRKPLQPQDIRIAPGCTEKHGVCGHVSRMGGDWLEISTQTWVAGLSRPRRPVWATASRRGSESLPLRFRAITRLSRVLVPVRQRGRVWVRRCSERPRRIAHRSGVASPVRLRPPSGWTPSSHARCSFRLPANLHVERDVEPPRLAGSGRGWRADAMGLRAAGQRGGEEFEEVVT